MEDLATPIANANHYKEGIVLGLILYRSEYLFLVKSMWIWYIDFAKR
jgi:hypothetical protein